MKDPDEQPDSFAQLFWETYEEMWTKDENGHIAIQTVKKWREQHGEDDNPADWWKADE